MVWTALDYHAETSDVQTAFLYGDLKEEIYLTKPEGWDIFLKKNDFHAGPPFLKLNKSIYGLVQAARTCWQKLMKTLKERGFETFQNDNCMVKKTTHQGIILMIIYVDDCLMIGNREAIKTELEELKKLFAMKHEEGVQDFIR